MPMITKEQRYQDILVAFMSHKNDIAYSKDAHFTNEELASLVPDDIVRFLKYKVYGNADANTNDSLPTEARSSSLEFYKKALSYFVPMRDVTWNEMTGVGNPTKSKDVNDLIKVVKKAEAQKKGKPGYARRELEEGEFLQTNELLNSNPDFQKRFMVPAAAKFQFHTIARVDDLVHLEETDLKHNPQFDYTLLFQTKRSRNMLEEGHDAPNQMIIGALNPAWCCLLGLALYLEPWKEFGYGDSNQYLFGNTDDPDRNKAFLQETWKNIWDSDEFIRLVPGPINGQSGQKFAETWARREGCDEDEINSRGRWHKKRAQVRHLSSNIPFSDAKVASVLCGGGPCKYELVEGSGISQEWLEKVVVPNMISKGGISKKVALVLAVPLLWAAMDADMEHFMLGSLRNRIQNAYAQIRVLKEGENPVRKRLLITFGQNQIRVAPIATRGTIGAGRNQQASFVDLSARLHALEVGQRLFQEEMKRHYHVILQEIDTLNKNVLRIAAQPVRHQRKNSQIVTQPVRRQRENGIACGEASLAPNLRSLALLWQEYTVGIGGRKPANQFTAQERGRVKCSYHRRKILWDQIGRLIQRGHTVKVAIDMIHAAYGQNSPTFIINKIRRDKALGGHPSLR